MIEWQPALDRPPPGTGAQPETAGLLRLAWRYNAPMRTSLIVCLLAVAAWSQSHLSPDKSPVSKSDSTQAASQKEEPNDHKQPAHENVASNKNQVGALVEGKKTAANADEELKINRQLAMFTGRLAWFTAALVLVGALQLLALRRQAKVLTHHSDLIRQSIDQMKRAVDAYDKYVAVAESGLELTRESNETNKVATDLTRKALVLTQRPRLRVRLLALREPTVDQLMPPRMLSEYLFPPTDPIKGSLSVVNSGEGEAVIRGSYCRIFHGGPPSKFPIEPPYLKTAGGQPLHHKPCNRGRPPRDCLRVRAPLLDRSNMRIGSLAAI